MNRLKLNRRSFIASAAAAATIPSYTDAQTPFASPAAQPVETSRVLIGVGTDRVDGAFPRILITDEALSPVAEAKPSAKTMSTWSLAAPHRAVLNTLEDPVWLDTETGATSEVEWEGRPQSIMVLPPDDPHSRNASTGLIGNTDFSSAILIDYVSGVARDITEFVAPPNAKFVPVTPSHSQDGTVAGVWTGDHVYLLDVRKPESARKLVGDDDSLFSTSVDIDPTTTWCGFTTYTPGNRGPGQVNLTPVGGTDVIPVADSDAWGEAMFLPNDPQHVVIKANGTMDVRAVIDPTKVIAKLGSIEAQTYYHNIWNADNTAVLMGFRDHQKAPINWRLLNVKEREVVNVPKLKGMFPIQSPYRNVALDHVLFSAVSPGARGETDIVSFTFSSAEVRTLLKGVHISHEGIQMARWCTISRSGAWATLITRNKGDNRGAWILDVANGKATALPWSDGTYTVAAGIHPEGTHCAITTIRRPSGDFSTSVVPTATPDQSAESIPGALLTWT